MSETIEKPVLLRLGDGRLQVDRWPAEIGITVALMMQAHGHRLLADEGGVTFEVDVNASGGPRRARYNFTHGEEGVMFGKLVH